MLESYAGGDLIYILTSFSTGVNEGFDDVFFEELVLGHLVIECGGFDWADAKI